MSNVVRKKKLTRGEKMLLVAPLFCAALFFGVVWFRNKTKPIAPFLTIEAPPKTDFSNAAFSPKGEYVIAVGEAPSTINCTMRVYDARSGMLLFTKVIGGAGWSPSGLAISSNSQFVVTGSENTLIWNLQTGALQRKLTKGKDYYERDIPVRADSLELSPDNRVLAVGGGRTSLWNAKSGEFLRYIDKSDGYFKPNQENFIHNFPRFSPDGKTLACISEGGIYPETDNGINGKPTKNTDGRLQIWDVASGKLARVLSPKNVIAFTFSPNVSKVAISIAPTDKKGQPRTYLYDYQSGQVIWTAQITGDTGYKKVLLNALDLAFSPDGKTLACQDEWGQITFYDTVSGQMVHTLPYQSEPTHWGGWGTKALPQSLSFSQDGKTLFSRHGNTLYLWNTDDWKHKL